jgi:hypothetical protein
VFPLNLYARVRFCQINIARETAGAARTRSSLRPLCFEGKVLANLGHIMPRDREVVFGLIEVVFGLINVIARSACDEAIHSSFSPRDGLLRYRSQ